MYARISAVVNVVLQLSNSGSVENEDKANSIPLSPMTCASKL
jgi:hypothetical protein